MELIHRFRSALSIAAMQRHPILIQNIEISNWLWDPPSLQFKFPARANFRSGKITTLSLFLNLRLYFHRGNQVSLERNIVTSEWYLFVNLGHFPWNRK